MTCWIWLRISASVIGAVVGDGFSSADGLPQRSGCSGRAGAMLARSVLFVVAQAGRLRIVQSDVELPSLDGFSAVLFDDGEDEP
jgi:hypothetical protein